MLKIMKKYLFKILKSYLTNLKFIIQKSKIVYFSRNFEWDTYTLRQKYALWVKKKNNLPFANNFAVGDTILKEEEEFFIMLNYKFSYVKTLFLIKKKNSKLNLELQRQWSFDKLESSYKSRLTYTRQKLISYEDEKDREHKMNWFIFYNLLIVIILLMD